MNRGSLAVICLGFAGFALASPGLTKGVTVPQSEYRTLVRECRSFLSGREISEARAKQLAARLRAVSSVTTPTGATVSVDTKNDADALDAVTGTTPPKKLRDRFIILDEQLTTGETFAAEGDPRVTAQSVLAAEEFAASRPKSDVTGEGWDWGGYPDWVKSVGNAIGDVFRTIGKWLGKALENIFRAIGKFFRWLFNKFPQAKWNPRNPFASLGNNVLLTLYFLATVAAVVGVYFLARYLFDLYEVKSGRRRSAGILGGDLDLSNEGITDPLTTARERAAIGDYRAAIRLTYIASLWKLGDAGFLTLEKNRTNGEYQRALRQKSLAVHDDFSPATRLFDRVWYGKQPGTRAEFETVSAIYDKLPTPETGQPLP